MMEKLGIWLYKVLEAMPKKPDKILHNDAVRQDLQTLEPAGNTPKRQKKYVADKLALCAVIAVIGIILSVAIWIKEWTATGIADNMLERNAYGDGTRSVALVADDGEKTYDIPLNVEEQGYTREELAELCEVAIPLLEQSILGENESFDKVEYDLRLVTGVEGYPFDISWRTDGTYIDYEGCLVNDVLATPCMAELTAQLDCGTFRAEHTICVMVYGKAVQPGMAERIVQRVNEREGASRESEFMTLPSEVDGLRLTWSYKKSYNGLLFLAATPIIVLLIYFGRDRDLHRQVEEREEQMRLDYPEIVSSLALLVGAGMTVPNAWVKIAKDYKCRKEETGKSRYAYEEMLITVYEMESGVAQLAAYERFGRRCRIPRYNKLATMLSQNIRKGAANLPMLLKAEAADAFEERKHMARKIGEKAGTKLLVPMMMFLGMILVVIMIPAFQSYL